MSTIEYHYQTVGRILVHLVEKGLSRIDLDPPDAMKIMTEQRGDEEETLKVFADCLRWMIDEGLIRTLSADEFEGGFAFSGVQLTSTGIAMIRRDPQDSNIGCSIEHRVSRAKGEPMDPGVYTKIGEFVGGALGGFTKSISGG